MPAQYSESDVQLVLSKFVQTFSKWYPTLQLKSEQAEKLLRKAGGSSIVVLDALRKTGNWVQKLANNPKMSLPGFYAIMRSVEGSISFTMANQKDYRKRLTPQQVTNLREEYQSFIGDFHETPFCLTEAEASDILHRYRDVNRILDTFQDVGTWLRTQVEMPSQQDVVDQLWFQLEQGRNV